MSKELKIAIIGCGQICEAHIGEIALLSNAKLVAVCDLYTSLAEDIADRHGIPCFYTDFEEMLKKEQPDVVHLTTPPQTHLPIGTQLLESGCHIYVEKPFCTSKAETILLIEKANQNNVLICAGYGQIYDLATERFNTFLSSGRLGEIVHVESYYGDSLEGSFSRVFLSTTDHWIHQLPGKLFQNVITHAIYHIVPLFPGEMDKVVCFASDRSENGVLQDELRVVMQSGKVTGYLTYTCGVRPISQFIRVYGSKAIAEIDFTNHIFSYNEGTSLPGPLARTRNAIAPGVSLIMEGLKNAKNIVTGKDRFFSGLGGLFNEFYSNIILDTKEPPIPYEQVIGVSDLMDKIVQSLPSETMPNDTGGRKE